MIPLARRLIRRLASFPRALIERLAPVVGQINPLVPLPGVLAVCLAAGYHGAWWGVAVTIAMEGVLLGVFWWAWAEAVGRAAREREEEVGR